MSDVEINVVASAEGVVTGGKFHNHDPWRMVASCPECVPVDVPEGVEYVEPEVRELARGIAADIRRYGHWQSGQPGAEEAAERGAHCIVTSPTWRWMNDDELRIRENFVRLLLPGWDECTFRDVWVFNDHTPTADVLAALDRIAEGLVER